MHPADPPLPAPGVEHSIVLTNRHPVKQMAYRQSPMKQDVVRANVKQLLDRKLIVEFNSPWSLPVVLVPRVPHRLAHGDRLQEGEQ